MYSPKRHTTCPKKSYAQRAPIFGRKLKSLTFFTCRRWCFLRWKSASVYVIWLLFDFETLFRSFLQIRLMHYSDTVIYGILIALSNRTVLNCWKNVRLWTWIGGVSESQTLSEDSRSEMTQPVWWEYSKLHFYWERRRYIRLQRDRLLIPPEERLSSGGIKTDWILTMIAKSDMLYSRIIYEFSCWFSGLRQSKFVVRRFTFSAIAGIKKAFLDSLR